MNKTKVFIDGKEGTTGLLIYDRLSVRDDIALLTLSEEKRKDFESRLEMINSADIAFLCLPDAAAAEIASAVSDKVCLIDTSTAHRTEKNWTYGFPELSGDFYEKIKTSNRIASPGCHASGFIALVKPLVDAGILSKDSLISCFSTTGYTGGGKKMIAQYEAEDAKKYESGLLSPRQYGITQNHKHLKEMKIISGLENAPVFCPIVSNFSRGMTVTVPLFKNGINGSAEEIKEIYKKLYKGPVVSYDENIDNGGFIASDMLFGKDSMKISVCGNEDRILLVASYDNLGKGASGAAMECMNIKIGAPQTAGLNI